MTPRFKHYAIKYHWFREFVKFENIVSNKIDTKLQLADILTKRLPKEQFSILRKIVLGWQICTSQRVNQADDLNLQRD